MTNILNYKNFSFLIILSAMLLLPLQAELRLICEPMSGAQLTTKNSATIMKPESLTNYSNLKFNLTNEELIFNNDIYKLINKSKDLISGVFTTENSTSVVSINLKNLEVTFSHHVVRDNEDYLLSVQGKCHE